MQKFTKTQIVLLIVIIALGVLALVSWQGLKEKSATPPPVVQNQNWKTYTNTSYGYSVSYPTEANIVPRSEEDSTPIEQINDLDFGIPGTGTSFSIRVILPYKYAPKDLADERLRLATTSLDQFAKMLYQYQIEEKNPNMKDKEIGKLEEITFAGQKSYSFTLTKGFAEIKDGERFSGYVIPNGTTYNFILTKNKDAKNMVISYPIGDSISEQMKDFFEFAAQ
jgi:hypothetical protein